MCRMLGIFGEVDEWQRIVSAFNQLAISGNIPPGTPPGHRDGWGMAACLSKGQAMMPLMRRSTSAIDDPIIAETIKRIKSPPGIFIYHLRKASPGIPVTLENAHPFFADQWAFVHNGTVHQADTLPRSPSLKITSQDSDSEYLFHYLLTALVPNGSRSEDCESLATAIKALPVDHTSVTSILCNSQSMVVIRKYKEHRQYYTLYIYRLPKAVVIASEPIEVDGLLNSDLWEMIPNDTITHISGDPPHADRYHI